MIFLILLANKTAEISITRAMQLVAMSSIFFHHFGSDNEDMNGRHRVSVATHGPLSAHASIHTQLPPSYLDLEDLFSNKYKSVEC